MRIVWCLLIIIWGCTTEKDWYTPAYAPFSPSVIHLKFSDDPLDSVSVSAVAYTNIPRGSNESNLEIVGKSGDYYLNIETDRPAKSFLNLGKEQYNVFLFPNDTTHINVNVAQSEIALSFYGKAKEINEYYFEKRKDLGYTDTRFPLNEKLSSKSTFKLIKQRADSIINREKLYFEAYTSSHQIPEWFVEYEQSEIIYMGAGYKTAMPHANEIQKYFKDTLPGDYYDYLSKIKIDNPRAILSERYLAFLNEYFLRTLPVAETGSLSGFSRTSKIMSHIFDQSKDVLSGDVREVYNKSNFSSLIEFYADSASIDSLANALRLSDYKELVRIAGTRSKNELQKLNLNRGDTIPDFILTNTLDSLVSIREFKDQILYLNFWATWCGPCIHNMPELNKMVESYDRNPNVKILNICVDSEHDKWLASVKKYKVKGVNLFAAGNWNSKLRSYFNITGIPHYVIINKGNILSENATDKAPQVQQKIDAVLAKQSSYDGIGRKIF